MYILNVFILLMVKYVARGNESSEENTLTTALLRESTYPKPSTIFRRINVEKGTDEESSTLLDLFKFAEDTRRAGIRRTDTIWNWDHWCQLQPRKGQCEKTLKKTYYDIQLDQCVPFTYSGCDGNKNNFETIVDCERHCKGSSFMAVKDTTKPTYCFLQPDAGLCIALITKYYFDLNEKTCKKFIYGGCGGNQNKFDTNFSCMKTCGGMLS